MFGWNPEKLGIGTLIGLLSQFVKLLPVPGSGVLSQLNKPPRLGFPVENPEGIPVGLLREPTPGAGGPSGSVPPPAAPVGRFGAEGDP